MFSGIQQQEDKEIVMKNNNKLKNDKLQRIFIYEAMTKTERKGKRVKQQKRKVG